MATAPQRRKRKQLRMELLESRALLAAHLDLQLNQTSVSEGAGIAAISATVTRIDASSITTALTVIVSVDDVDEISFPATITIPANQVSTTFSIDTINDAVVDGSATVTMTVSAVGFTSGNSVVTVTDDDTVSTKTIGGKLAGTIASGEYGVSHTITVEAGRQLTISPGATFQFPANQGVDVFGQLLAQADADQPIVFTSSAVTPAPGDWKGVSFLGDTTQVPTLLKNVAITYAKIGASMTGQGLPVTIDSSEIAFSETVGIFATRAGTATQTVSNSFIHDNGSDGVRISASGSGCTSRSTGITLRGNEIDHNNNSAISMSASGSSTCLIGGGSGTVLPIITGNRIHSNLHGITGNAFSGSRSGFLQPQIQNNFIYDNLQDGISLVTNGSASTISSVVVNNTVVRNGRDGIFHTTPAGPNMRLYNNQVVGNSRGFATNAGATLTAGTTGFNNVFSNSGGNWSNFPAGVGTPTIVNANGTPADDYFNISVDAGFAADNLHLRTDSLLVGAGSAAAGISAPTVDFDGDQRETPTDIGADEVPKLRLSFGPIGSLLDTSTGVKEFFQIRESTVTGTVAGTVRRSVADLSSPLTVSIANPNPSALTLPASVTIPTGNATATFSVNSVDDGNVESDTDVAISVSAPATAAMSSTVRVVDDELLPAEPVNADEHRINLAETANTQTDADVAWLSDTQYVAVWKSNTTTQSHSVRARIFNITDQPVGEEILIATVPGGSGEQRPQVGVDGNGNFVVAWSWVELISSVATRMVMSRRFSAAGTPLTNEITLATGTGVSPGLNSLAVATDGSWSLLFQDYAISTPNVFVQRFSPEGVQEGLIESFPFSNSTDHSAITYDSAGNLITVGLASTGILGKKYTASTDTWSQVFVVSPTPIGAGAYFSPAVESADDGSFVVSWLQRNFPIVSVLAKRMNADGSPSTDDLIVASGTAISLGRSPSVVSSSTGDFIVTWALSTGEIMVRQYHRDGLPVNNSQQLNASTGSHAFPRIALSPNEKRLISIWEGNGPGDASGVFARRLNFPQPAIQLSLDKTELAEAGDVVNATITRSDVNMTGALTVSLTSDKPSQINLPESVTIPAGQASATFPFTAIDETEVDGTQFVTVSTNANSFENAAAEVTVFDNDARLTVSISVDSFAENAGVNTAIVTVRRNSSTFQPLIVSLSTGDTDEIAIPSSVTIPAGTDAVEFAIDSVNDSLVDGDQIASIRASATGHADGSDTVVVSDDDVAGVSVTETNGATEVTEGGASDSVDVVLTAQPMTNVVLNVVFAAANEVTLDRQLLTFSTSNWNQPQTVTLFAVDDGRIEATEMSDLTFRIDTTKTDPAFAAIPDQKIVARVIDNDFAGFTIVESDGMTSVTEPDTQDSFSIALTAQPTTNVVLTLANPDPGEVHLDKLSLTFTPFNWNSPQVVAVTAVDDFLVDGLQTIDVVVAVNTTSSDDAFDPVASKTVSITIVDDDTRGITVSAISGNTTEAGGSATFTVVLDSQPTVDVTIPLSSSETTEGAVAPTALVFTPGNWNLAQTVTVTGVNDDIDDGDVVFNVLTALATGGDYAGLDADDVGVTNTDDDTRGITLSTISGNTTEADGTATFTVVLNSQPTGNVTIPLSSSDTSEGSVSLATLTFTPTDWNIAQTITVTGVDDDVDDGDMSFSIVIAPASGGDYAGVDAEDISVTNNDDDTRGITVSAVSGDTTEAGGTATFTVVLDSQPTADVTIPLSSSDTSEGIVSLATLTFTPTNWNVAQTVTVTGLDDDVDDGDVTLSIVIASASGGDYAGVDADDISVTNSDDDTRGITVSTISGNTTEAGGTATFTVVLDSQPTADVTIPVSSSDTSEGSVSPATLTFTPANWNVAQTVTVTGVDDDVDDGDVTFSIVVASANGGDFDGVDADDVNLTNNDDDTRGITVSTISGNTTEAGGTATFTVVLASQPTADVTIPISSSDTSEGSVSLATLTFTPANWNVAQTVTVTGLDDDVDDGDVTLSIVIAPASGGDYAGLDADDLGVTNTDDDTRGITVSPISGDTTEAGGTATFTVVLASQPTADVTIPLSSSDTSEGSVSLATLTFTPANWNVAQTVTVTGLDDDVDDGDVSYGIVIGPADSGDYAGVDADDVSVTNSDDDTRGITVSSINGGTTEAGGTATFTVVLDSQPTADVTIPVSSSNTSEGTVAPGSLTFTTTNWNAAQTATVTGVNDDVDDGNVVFNVVTALATGGDYAGVDADDVSVTNSDDDTRGITVSAVSGNTTEAGGTATFTVVLNSQPTGNVTIPLSSSDTTEGSVSPATLTFTPTNWNVVQTVTATGLDDDVDDGDVAFSIVIASASGGDYAGVDADDVNVTNSDDDSAGFRLSKNVVAVSESGTSDTFTVVLDSQPTTAVTLTVVSDMTDEVTVDTSALTFTPDNWNVAQTVTVTGVSDGVVDGDQNSTITVSVNVGESDDSFDNVANQTVSVPTTDVDVDTDASPVLSTPSDITVEGDITGGVSPTNPAIIAFLSAASATDDTDPNPSITHNAPASFALGETIVTFVATDDGGNSSMATASIFVVDTTAPTLTAPASISVVANGPAGASVTLPTINTFLLAASATDIVDATPTVTHDAPELFPIGATTVTFSVMDAAGNQQTATAVVTVIRQSTGEPVVNVSPSGPNGLPDPENLPGMTSQPTSWARQRTSLREISIDFPAPINIPTSDGIVLTNLGMDADNDPDTAIPLRDDQLSLSEDGMQLRITLDTSQLRDGVYHLELSSAVTGGESFSMTGDSTNKLFVLYGDWNGSSSVTAADFATFAYWFGQSVPPAPEYVDGNNSGSITAADFARFAANFGRSISFPTTNSPQNAGEGELTEVLVSAENPSDVDGDRGVITSEDLLSLSANLTSVVSESPVTSHHNVGRDSHGTVAQEQLVCAPELTVASSRSVQTPTVSQTTEHDDDEDSEASTLDDIITLLAMAHLQT